MSRERISMRRVREVLRLKHERMLGNRAIGTACLISAGSVHDYLQRARVAGLSWPLPEGLSDEALEHMLFPPVDSLPASRPVPDWGKVALELRRKGVTLRLLWEEYRCAEPVGLGYSRFCESFKEYSAALDPRMRLVHKAGEKLYVDYAGPMMYIVNRSTGELVGVPVFVATWGASDYTYVEATRSQELPDFIGSHIRAYTFSGGVPEIVVLDNLKSGITRACLYEPDVNRTYKEMNDHYGVVVIAARPSKPRDKAIVENHVRTVEQRIMAPLRDRRFFSLAELNEAMWDLLDVLNDQPFQKMAGSRRSLFNELDVPAMRPLPAGPYSYGEWKKASVHIDYHIELDKCYYSVPYQLVKQGVEVRVGACTVEVFHKNTRVASHPRLFIPGSWSTLKEHMPANHRHWGDWNPQRLIAWAAQTGPSTSQLVEGILTRYVHPEQGYRSCLGIISLGKKYGPDRVEAACARALSFGAFTYKNVKLILANSLDRAPTPDPESTAITPAHANIRGASYYGSAQRPQLSLDMEGNDNAQSSHE